MGKAGSSRRTIVLGAAALGLSGPAFAQQARRDLYNGELDYLAKEFSGAADDLPASITIATNAEPGERMSISGHCLSWQSGEPAAGVIVYAYHTDIRGLYDGGPSGTRHARLRGWMRTGADGRYAFSSIKPAPYPNPTMPAHVHFIVMEPGKPPCWIDDIVFDGEFRVDAAYRAKMKLRGGNGIIPLKKASGVWSGVRDIRLERHPA